MRTFIVVTILLFSISSIAKPSKEDFYKFAKKYVNSVITQNIKIQTDEDMRKMVESMKTRNGNNPQIKALEEELKKDKFLLVASNTANPMESVQVLFLDNINNPDIKKQEMEKDTIDGREIAFSSIKDMGINMGMIFVQLSNDCVIGIVKIKDPNTKEDMIKELDNFNIKEFEKL
ncbi:MAG: hypothetical protein CR982_00525 [Candidatus Cloacimonadota bacterium]|nr:MAG: hypothetical protein CR982_00525 [Candidatus Cloacimonadota bacterium]PIE78870.1 MAG: hypothetical protein CSA15_05625 [Candidatus Delongbacteria bacterium]